MEKPRLSEEEQRAVAERLTEEELAILDLLTKPEMEFSKKERAQVKKAARELLASLKREKLVLDWRKRQQARAEVRVTVETILDERLPRAYTPEMYRRKTDAVLQHIYDWGGYQSRGSGQTRAEVRARVNTPHRNGSTCQLMRAANGSAARLISSSGKRAPNPSIGRLHLLGRHSRSLQTHRISCQPPMNP